MISLDFKDYELIDASAKERLERWGNIILIRPDPQIIWNTEKTNPFWKTAHAVYHRSSTGGGSWKELKKIPPYWQIGFNDLIFNIKTMGFKHTGIFPEQAVNWDFINKKIKGQDKKLKVLNLFAYTGAATLVCAQAGSEVTHVDSSKGMVFWAKENAKSSSLENKPVRWIVDDCFKFVEREIRRENKYDAIIMDPPSYGRGPNGEIWKLEEKLYDLLQICSKVLCDKPVFFILNSYTTGLSPDIMKYMLEVTLKGKFRGKVFADEIGLKVTESKLTLPCGSTAIWENF